MSKYVLMQMGLAALVCCSSIAAKESQPPPNVVIIFLDDSAYADFHPFGHPAYKTPHVAKLAEQGLRLNQFYVPQAVCSASRSALLSGCYPGRTKVFGAHGPNVIPAVPKCLVRMARRAGGWIRNS